MGILHRKPFSPSLTTENLGVDLQLNISSKLSCNVDDTGDFFLSEKSTQQNPRLCHFLASFHAFFILVAHNAYSTHSATLTADSFVMYSGALGQ